MLFGVWFLFELLTGVLFSNFLIAKKNAQHSFLKESHIKWLEIQQLILKESSAKQFFFPPTKIKQKIYQIFKSTLFKNSIKVVLYLNILSLFFYFEDEKQKINSLEFLSFRIFTLIYFIESVFKIYSIGTIQYIKFRKIEFLIISGYLIDTITLFCLKSNSILIKNNSYFRVLRIFKILPVFRVLDNAKSIEKTLNALKFILPFILNIIGLYIVNLFIFSILGCFLFGSIVKGEYIDDYVNFSNIFYGMITLFKCATGDDWSKIMIDTMENSNCTPMYKTCGTSLLYNHFFIKVIFIIIDNLIITKKKQNFS